MAEETFVVGNGARAKTCLSRIHANAILLCSFLVRPEAEALGLKLKGAESPIAVPFVSERPLLNGTICASQ